MNENGNSPSERRSLNKRRDQYAHHNDHLEDLMSQSNPKVSSTATITHCRETFSPAEKDHEPIIRACDPMTNKTNSHTVIDASVIHDHAENVVDIDMVVSSGGITTMMIDKNDKTDRHEHSTEVAPSFIHDTPVPIDAKKPETAVERTIGYQVQEEHDTPPRRPRTSTRSPAHSSNGSNSRLFTITVPHDQPSDDGLFVLPPSTSCTLFSPSSSQGPHRHRGGGARSAGCFHTQLLASPIERPCTMSSVARVAVVDSHSDDLPPPHGTHVPTSDPSNRQSETTLIGQTPSVTGVRSRHPHGPPHTPPSPSQSAVLPPTSLFSTPVSPSVISPPTAPPPPPLPLPPTQQAVLPAVSSPSTSMSSSSFLLHVSPTIAPVGRPLSPFVVAPATARAPSPHTPPHHLASSLFRADLEPTGVSPSRGDTAEAVLPTCPQPKPLPPPHAAYPQPPPPPPPPPPVTASMALGSSSSCCSSVGSLSDRRRSTIGEWNRSLVYAHCSGMSDVTASPPPATVTTAALPHGAGSLSVPFGNHRTEFAPLPATTPNATTVASSDSCHPSRSISPTHPSQSLILTSFNPEERGHVLRGMKRDDTSSSVDTYYMNNDNNNNDNNNNNNNNNNVSNRSRLEQHDMTHDVLPPDESAMAPVIISLGGSSFDTAVHPLPASPSCGTQKNHYSLTTSGDFIPFRMPVGTPTWDCNSSCKSGGSPTTATAWVAGGGSNSNIHPVQHGYSNSLSIKQKDGNGGVPGGVPPFSMSHISSLAGVGASPSSTTTMTTPVLPTIATFKMTPREKVLVSGDAACTPTPEDSSLVANDELIESQKKEDSLKSTSPGVIRSNEALEVEHFYSLRRTPTSSSPAVSHWTTNVYSAEATERSKVPQEEKPIGREQEGSTGFSVQAVLKQLSSSHSHNNYSYASSSAVEITAPLNASVSSPKRGMHNMSTTMVATRSSSTSANNAQPPHASIASSCSFGSVSPSSPCALSNCTGQHQVPSTLIGIAMNGHNHGTTQQHHGTANGQLHHSVGHTPGFSERAPVGPRMSWNELMRGSSQCSSSIASHGALQTLCEIESPPVVRVLHASHPPSLSRSFCGGSCFSSQNHHSATNVNSNISVSGSVTTTPLHQRAPSPTAPHSLATHYVLPVPPPPPTCQSQHARGPSASSSANTSFCSTIHPIPNQSTSTEKDNSDTTPLHRPSMLTIKQQQQHQQQYGKKPKPVLFGSTNVPPPKSASVGCANATGFVSASSTNLVNECIPDGSPTNTESNVATTNRISSTLTDLLSPVPQQNGDSSPSTLSPEPPTTVRLNAGVLPCKNNGLNAKSTGSIPPSLLLTATEAEPEEVPPTPLHQQHPPPPPTVFMNSTTCSVAGTERTDVSTFLSSMDGSSSTLYTLPLPTMTLSDQRVNSASGQRPVKSTVVSQTAASASTRRVSSRGKSKGTGTPISLRSTTDVSLGKSKAVRHTSFMDQVHDEDDEYEQEHQQENSDTEDFGTVTTNFITVSSDANSGTTTATSSLFDTTSLYPTSGMSIASPSKGSTHSPQKQSNVCRNNNKLPHDASFTIVKSTPPVHFFTSLSNPVLLTSCSIPDTAETTQHSHTDEPGALLPSPLSPPTKAPSDVENGVQSLQPFKKRRLCSVVTLISPVLPSTAGLEYDRVPPLEGELAPQCRVDDSMELAEGRSALTPAHDESSPTSERDASVSAHSIKTTSHIPFSSSSRTGSITPLQSRLRDHKKKKTPPRGSDTSELVAVMDNTSSPPKDVIRTPSITAPAASPSPCSPPTRGVAVGERSAQTEKRTTNMDDPSDHKDNSEKTIALRRACAVLARYCSSRGDRSHNNSGCLCTPSTRQSGSNSNSIHSSSGTTAVVHDGDDGVTSSGIQTETQNIEAGEMEASMTSSETRHSRCITTPPSLTINKKSRTRSGRQSSNTSLRSGSAGQMADFPDQDNRVHTNMEKMNVGNNSHHTLSSSRNTEINNNNNNSNNNSNNTNNHTNNSPSPPLKLDASVCSAVKGYVEPTSLNAALQAIEDDDDAGRKDGPSPLHLPESPNSPFGGGLTTTGTMVTATSDSGMVESGESAMGFLLLNRSGPEISLAGAGAVQHQQHDLRGLSSTTPFSPNVITAKNAKQGKQECLEQQQQQQQQQQREEEVKNITSSRSTKNGDDVKEWVASSTSVDTSTTMNSSRSGRCSPYSSPPAKNKSSARHYHRESPIHRGISTRAPSPQDSKQQLFMGAPTIEISEGEREDIENKEGKEKSFVEDHVSHTGTCPTRRTHSSLCSSVSCSPGTEDMKQVRAAGTHTVNELAASPSAVIPSVPSVVSVEFNSLGESEVLAGGGKEQQQQSTTALKLKSSDERMSASYAKEGMLSAQFSCPTMDTSGVAAVITPHTSSHVFSSENTHSSSSLVFSPFTTPFQRRDSLEHSQSLARRLEGRASPEKEVHRGMFTPPPAVSPTFRRQRQENNNQAECENHTTDNSSTSSGSAFCPYRPGARPPPPPPPPAPPPLTSAAVNVTGAGSTGSPSLLPPTPPVVGTSLAPVPRYPSGIDSPTRSPIRKEGSSNEATKKAAFRDGAAVPFLTDPGDNGVTSSEVGSPGAKGSHSINDSSTNSSRSSTYRSCGTYNTCRATHKSSNTKRKNSNNNNSNNSNNLSSHSNSSLLLFPLFSGEEIAVGSACQVVSPSPQEGTSTSIVPFAIFASTPLASPSTAGNATTSRPSAATPTTSTTTSLLTASRTAAQPFRDIHQMKRNQGEDEGNVAHNNSYNNSTNCGREEEVPQETSFTNAGERMSETSSCHAKQSSTATSAPQKKSRTLSIVTAASSMLSLSSPSVSSKDCQYVLTQRGRAPGAAASNEVAVPTSVPVSADGGDDDKTGYPVMAMGEVSPHSGGAFTLSLPTDGFNASLGVAGGSLRSPASQGQVSPLLLPVPPPPSAPPSLSSSTIGMPVVVYPLPPHGLHPPPPHSLFTSEGIATMEMSDTGTNYSLSHTTASGTGGNHNHNHNSSSSGSSYHPYYYSQVGEMYQLWTAASSSGNHNNNNPHIHNNTMGINNSGISMSAPNNHNHNNSIHSWCMLPGSGITTLTTTTTTGSGSGTHHHHRNSSSLFFSSMDSPTGALIASVGDGVVGDGDADGPQRVVQSITMITGGSGGAINRFHAQAHHSQSSSSFSNIIHNHDHHPHPHPHLHRRHSHSPTHTHTNTSSLFDSGMLLHPQATAAPRPESTTAPPSPVSVRSAKGPPEADDSCGVMPVATANAALVTSPSSSSSSSSPVPGHGPSNHSVPNRHRPHRGCRHHHPVPSGRRPEKNQNCNSTSLRSNSSSSSNSVGGSIMHRFSGSTSTNSSNNGNVVGSHGTVSKYSPVTHHSSLSPLPRVVVVSSSILSPPPPPPPPPPPMEITTPSSIPVSQTLQSADADAGGGQEALVPSFVSEEASVLSPTRMERSAEPLGRSCNVSTSVSCHPPLHPMSSSSPSSTPPPSSSSSWWQGSVGDNKGDKRVEDGNLNGGRKQEDVSLMTNRAGLASSRPLSIETHAFPQEPPAVLSPSHSSTAITHAQLSPPQQQPQQQQQVGGDPMPPLELVCPPEFNVESDEYRSPMSPYNNTVAFD